MTYNHILLYFGLLGCLLMPPGWLRGQDTTRLTLEESIVYALEHNRNIQNARFDQYIADQRVRETIASGYPQISGSADMQYFVALPTTILPGDFNPVQDPVTGEIRPGDPLEVKFGFPWQSTAGVNVNQLLFDGTFFIGLKAARTFVDLSRLAADRTEEETILAVTKAYYQSLIAKEQQQLVQANIARIRRLYSETQALYEAGFAEKIDADRLHINLTNLELEDQKIRRYADMSLDLLKFQMGMPIATAIVLDATMQDLTEAPNMMLSFDGFDLRMRTEYQLLQTQEQLEKYNTQRIRAGYLPSLYAFSSFQVNAQRDSFDFFSADQRWFPISVVGLQLSIPIFDGFRKQAQMAQSQLELRKIQNQYALLESSIQLELKTAHLNLLNAYNSLEANRSNVALAREVAEVSQIKYKEGVGSSLEVNDAETQLKLSETNYLNSLFEYLMARADLSKAKGEFAHYSAAPGSDE
ncbi:MAG: TolC family protein [Bacteroidia bacterium]